MIDLEHPHLMTDAERKQVLKAWEACKPKTDIKFGIPLVFGTGGETPIGSNFFNDLWNGKNR